MDAVVVNFIVINNSKGVQ